jgi:uncharacterized membrane protein
MDEATSMRKDVRDLRDSTTQVEGQVTGDGNRRLFACWCLAAVWLALFIASAIFVGSPMGGALWAVQFLLLLAIAFLQATLLYGLRGALIYLAAGFVVGLTLEASSIANGFPFGSFVHNSPGPRLLEVPLQATLIYAVYGWFAWMIARLLCSELPVRISSAARYFAPVCGSFILAGYDFGIDPIMASIFKLWTFAEPSGQFGVPLSNFLGWALSGWVIFQLIALLERNFTLASASNRPSFWLLPCLIWIAQGLQFPIMWLFSASATITAGASSFAAADVFEASTAVGLLTVVFCGFLGLVRLGQMQVRGHEAS